MHEQNDQTKQLNKAIELFIAGETSLSEAAEYYDIQTADLIRTLSERKMHVNGLPDRIFKKDKDHYQLNRSKKIEFSKTEFDDDLFADVDEPFDIEEPKKEAQPQDKEAKQNAQPRQKSTGRNPNPESTLFKLRELLKKNGPLHIKEILKQLGLDPIKECSLAWTLNKKSKEKQVFVKVAPSCFGLLSDNLIPYNPLDIKNCGLKPGSILAKAEDILKKHGVLSLNDIAKNAGIKSLNKKKSLRKSLSDCVKQGRVFIKTEPGCYGLIESKPQTHSPLVNDSMAETPTLA